MRDRPSRILIADDVSDVRKLTRRAIEEYTTYPFLKNAHFYEAGTVLEAVEMARKYDPDVCVVDLDFGDGRGAEAGYSLVKSISSICDAAIIVFSVEDDDEGLPRALENGADEFVEKKTLLDKRREVLAFRVDQSVQRNLESRADRAGSECQVFAYRIGNSIFRLGSRYLETDDVRIRLTLAEYTLLKVFCANNFASITELELYLELYGDAPKQGDKKLQNALSRFRKKIGAYFDIRSIGSGIYAIDGHCQKISSD